MGGVYRNFFNATLTPCFVLKLDEELREVSSVGTVLLMVRLELEFLVRVDGFEGEVTHGFANSVRCVLVQQPQHLPAPLLHHRIEQRPDLRGKEDTN